MRRVPVAPQVIEPQRAEVPRSIEALDEGTVLDERYRLGKVIGAGGTASVRIAHDLLLRRDVAVKIFNARVLSGAELHVQESEARVIAALNHFALTSLFDAGVEAGPDDTVRIYLVMELVDGTDLRTRLKSGPLSVAEACWMGFDLAEALDYVHRSGFVHRDVKPANVLLSNLRSHKPIVAKLADFGIATMIGQPDMSEFTVGTAAYLSPEQVEGHDVGPESDVYSLGLVLLEAITGRVEFPGGVVESAFARLDRQPVIPDHVPEQVAEILAGMTALRPADRLPLVEAARRFQQFLVDELIRSRRLAPALVEDDEAARVGALHRYEVLDTEPDEAFDAITRLASRMLNVPIALVTLIDMNRVWFKSSIGWDEKEVGRDVAFCSTTSPGTGRPWTIADALQDDRTRSNPLVVDGPLVRAYAGAPLTTRDGHFLGALCAFDKQPRDFTPSQLDCLADLADLVMHEMEMRRAMRRALFAEP
ncbi:serine/threonine protein kinase [Amnibacterium kyonggiense]|uniref:Serine/threonine protein kinase n=1 Tax=Amnibacterium kyonggiense TaxID=595671 RepID=A0A4R7FPC2_9MICO|nr:serine/threonine protein kinase [Amnibacterium kyonggiense]